MLDFPFSRGVIERVPDPEGDAVGMFSQFDCQITDRVQRFRVLQGRQRRGLEQRGCQGIEAITAGSAGSGSGYRPPPESDPFNRSGLRQQRKDARAHQRAFSRSARTHDQHKRSLRSDLRFQGFQHFPDCFRSTVEDGRVFEIEEIQPSERTGFPPAHITRNVFSDLPIYLTCQKITEMFPEELFKLLQVAIVVERASEVCLAIILPMRKGLL